MASTFRVEREQCIDAPPAAVRERVVDLRRWVSYGEVARPDFEKGLANLKAEAESRCVTDLRRSVIACRTRVSARPPRQP
jgi:hypothetical protein